MGATRSHQRRRSSFGLRSLLGFVTVCATLTALYPLIDVGPMFLLIYVSFISFAVSLVIEFCVLMTEMVGSSTQSRFDIEFEDSIEPDLKEKRELVENLRILEQAAMDRYNAATGSPEDVLRARGKRLTAEIDLIRQARIES